MVAFRVDFSDPSSFPQSLDTGHWFLDNISVFHRVGFTVLRNENFRANMRNDNAPLGKGERILEKNSERAFEDLSRSVSTIKTDSFLRRLYRFGS